MNGGEKILISIIGEWDKYYCIKDFKKNNYPNFKKHEIYAGISSPEGNLESGFRLFDEFGNYEDINLEEFENSFIMVNCMINSMIKPCKNNL